MTPDEILDIVCQYFRVSVEDIKGRGRSQQISVPRKVACFVLRNNLPLSYEDIGDFMGLRDHSTIMYAVRDVEKKLPSNPMLQKYLREIMPHINPPQDDELEGDEQIQTHV